MFQPQGALTGLAICALDGVPHVLLQARIEPGNTGVGQYGPTIQSTPATTFACTGSQATLKRLLATSNVASFQLRCAASLLLPSMNPHACSAPP